MEMEIYMKRCLELARLGAGSVSPNPMVGCVIVHEGKVIGEGWHRQYGQAHAEVNAIADAESKYGSEILRESTLYVNLEPCSHWGKTPPCADLIIGKGIPKVVIGGVDPNEKVSGKGIAQMREAGIEVLVGLLGPECLRFNRRFFTTQLHSRPYIILKWAQTADGYLDAERPSAAIPAAWMTGETARLLVHKWRAEEDAILVGRKTVELDNPSLTVRSWKGRNPVRIVLGEIPEANRSLYRIFDGEAQTLSFGHPKSIQHLLHDLWQQHKIQSVIAEGGASVLKSFIEASLWDEARIFTATDKTLAALYPDHPELTKGMQAPSLPASQTISRLSLGNTELVIAERQTND